MSANRGIPEMSGAGQNDANDPETDMLDWRPGSVDRRRRFHREIIKKDGYLLHLKDVRVSK
jgi:hypothetical protein